MKNEKVAVKYGRPVRGWLVWLMMLAGVVQAFGQERFRSIDFTNGFFNVQYQGNYTNGPILTNGTATLISGGSSNGWVDITSWGNVPVTMETAVSTGPAATNGIGVFQLNLASDLGGRANPPVPGLAGAVNIGTYWQSNSVSITNPLIGGITNPAWITYPAGFFTNWHYAQWGQFFCNGTNTFTNGPSVQKFRAHVYQ